MCSSGQPWNSQTSPKLGLRMAPWFCALWFFGNLQLKVVKYTHEEKSSLLNFIQTFNNRNMTWICFITSVVRKIFYQISLHWFEQSAGQQPCSPQQSILSEITETEGFIDIWRVLINVYWILSQLKKRKFKFYNNFSVVQNYQILFLYNMFTICIFSSTKSLCKHFL